MKKALLILAIITSFCFSAKADHITGGEMFYTHIGQSNGMHHYRFTIKLFMRCNSGRQFNNPLALSIYDKVTTAPYLTTSVQLTRQEKIELINSNPCITDPPLVCYDVGFYEFTLDLPASTNGYTVACQVFYRIAGINNLTEEYRNIGATYTAEIPGNSQVAVAAVNNSAKFIGNDLVVVCADNSFTYSFNAEDKDGDQLRYSFCNAYQSNSASGGNNSIPPGPPPYPSVPYSNEFSGATPLGPNVRIDSKTGIIKGIAPRNGVYVVTVCVEEIRNGIVIAIQRKDLQLNITSCTIAAASILPEYMLCRDSKTITLNNFSNSPLIQSYNWEIRNSNGTPIFSSTDALVNYTFPDAGTYQIKLMTNEGRECSDSAFAVAYVYPGFKPDFSTSGICFTKPTMFTDATITSYGEVKSWQWDFGEQSTTQDESKLQNPTYTYPTMGGKQVRLITSNTVGCVDTATKQIHMVDKPPLNLGFRDTLICSQDNVQLMASGNGTFTWAPSQTLSNSAVSSPIASPKTSTTYTVEMNENGCINKDSVTVRVVDAVSLQVMNDTTICLGDPITLRTHSNAFIYNWSPAAPLNNATLASPVATTVSTTTYTLTAAIGSCITTDKVVVTSIPYPTVNAGEDATICYNAGIQLTGITDGSRVLWSPATSLNDGFSLIPTARPLTTTAYVLTAYDTRGCPKPVRDTVVINVLPKIKAFAGRDTAVLINQPLQLNATGGMRYQWQPGINLSATDIPNPVALFQSPSVGLLYTVHVYDENNCVDSASLTIKVFNVNPTVFVPTAFTPNGDGRNDHFRPVAVGMTQIEYFNVYNRFGQLVFSTTINGQGWDGKINGQLQASGTYVWAVKAIDFTGKSYFKKGTVTLIQ